MCIPHPEGRVLQVVPQIWAEKVNDSVAGLVNPAGIFPSCALAMALFTAMVGL